MTEDQKAWLYEVWQEEHERWIQAMEEMDELEPNRG